MYVYTVCTIFNTVWTCCPVKSTNGNAYFYFLNFISLVDEISILISVYITVLPLDTKTYSPRYCILLIHYSLVLLKKTIGFL